MLTKEASGGGGAPLLPNLAGSNPIFVGGSRGSGWAGRADRSISKGGRGRFHESRCTEANKHHPGSCCVTIWGGGDTRCGLCPLQPRIATPADGRWTGSGRESGLAMTDAGPFDRITDTR